MFVCYRHSKVHVQTNGTPLCNLFNKPVYPFKNFIPKMCPFCPQNMKRNICNTKTGLVAGVFNWIYLWRVYINQINERKVIFLTQHPNISLNKEGVWSTNLREIISEILTDRQTKTEQKAHLNRHPTVSPDFNTSLWFLLMHSIGPWNYISWSFLHVPYLSLGSGNIPLKSSVVWRLRKKKLLLCQASKFNLIRGTIGGIGI